MHTHSDTVRANTPTPPKTSFNAHSPPTPPTPNQPPPPPSTLSNPPPPPPLHPNPNHTTTTVISPYLTPPNLLWLKTISSHLRFLLPAPASYTSIKPPTPSNKASPPPQYPQRYTSGANPTQTHMHTNTNTYTNALTYTQSDRSPLKNDGSSCVSGDLPLSSSGAREELQCDVTADAGPAGWWNIFTCECVWFSERVVGMGEPEEYNLVGGWTRWALLHHWTGKMNESLR